MPITITYSWRNDNPNTVWNRLAKKLGREPTRREAEDEVRRILNKPRNATEQYIADKIDN